MFFVLIKESQFSNFYVINITFFSLTNILNDSCRLNKMKQEFINLGSKLPYLVSIFRLIFKQKSIAIFEANLNFSKRKVSRKIKNLQIWDRKCFIWVFLVAILKNLEFLKFEISSLEIVFLQSLVQK